MHQNKDSLKANNEIGARAISDFRKFLTCQCEFDSLIFRSKKYYHETLTL